MNQLVLFPGNRDIALPTYVERNGTTLVIPEGIHTIPCTHGMHRFPGKFIPNLPRYIIRQYLGDNSSATVVDPFCGSGTTLVEAALEGRSYLGQDIDPLSILVSRAKTEPLSDDELTMIEEHWERFDYNQYRSDLVPDVANLSHWFTNLAIGQLSAIKYHCLDLPDRLRDFCLVVFSSIVRRVSNADDQTQKTYVSHTLPKTPPLPSELFPIFLQRAVSGMRQYTSLLPKASVGTIRRSDAKSIIEIGSASIITSPPYIDSIDYIYNQMLEYFWLLPELGISDLHALRALRKVPMGFRQAKDDTFTFVDRLSEKHRKALLLATGAIRHQSKKEAANVMTFFEDFTAHCDAAFKAQCNGSIYACVIGHSFVRGITIKTAEYFIDLFHSAGYRLVDRLTYEIRRHYMKFPRRSNSGKIDQDHVLIFER